MYLPLDRIRQVLAEIKKYVTRFRVSFDYMADAVISRTTGDAGITRLVESFAAMGAPWLSGIRDIQSMACELGLTLIDNVKTAELHQRYWVGRPMSSPIFDFYSVCTVSDCLPSRPVRRSAVSIDEPGALFLHALANTSAPPVSRPSKRTALRFRRRWPSPR